MARREIEGVLSQSPNSHFGRLWMARVLWDLGTDYAGECAGHLMQAAKLNPHSADCLAFLGHFYYRVAKSHAIARQCYEKSVSLDSSNIESGPALYELLIKAGANDDAFSLCKMITSTAKIEECVWAWLRLGHEYLRTNNYTEAIRCGQNVTRVDNDNAHGWELLGDAYVGRGGYIAAIRAFRRALELRDDFVYCSFRIASIDHVLGNDDDSIKEYKSILTRFPRYVPAMQGAAEAYYSQSKRLIQEGLTGAASASIIKALDYLVSALRISSHFYSTWKLLGDVCNLSNKVPFEVMLAVKLPADLLEFIKTTNQYHETDHILRLGGLAYANAAKFIEPSKRSDILGDVATNFWHRYNRLKSVNIQNEQGLLRDGINAVKQALKLRSSATYLWNILGVMCIEAKVLLSGMYQYLISNIHFSAFCSSSAFVYYGDSE